MKRYIFLFTFLCIGALSSWAQVFDAQQIRLLNMLQQGGGSSYTPYNYGGVGFSSNGISSFQNQGVSPSVNRESGIESRDEKIDQALSLRSFSAQERENMVFGRNMFTSKELSFDPNLNMATPVDYKLAAGDEVILDVWGDSEAHYSLVITPEGTVKIPASGEISLSGLTIEEAENKLKQHLSNIYSQLGNGEEEKALDLKVSLGRIRSIKVNLLGEVLVPGTYTLPSLASVFNALYVAGGVNDIGSLRNIKVYRNNKEVATIDVYDYLLKGDGSSNIRLQDNDVIIVAPYENLVKIQGDVKRGMIYELKKGETLGQLLEYAGGFAHSAYTDNLLVRRKTGSGYTLNTVPNSDFGSFMVQDGDLVEVQASTHKYDNRVSIGGAVWRPGDFEIKEGKTVLSLIEAAGGLRGDAFLNRGQITRQRPDYSYEMISFDVQALLNGQQEDIPLKEEDVVYIPSIYDLKYKEYIVVRGAVNKERDRFSTSNIDQRNGLLPINNIEQEPIDSGKIEQMQLSSDSIPVISQDTSMNKLFDFSKEQRFIKNQINSDTILYRQNMTLEDAILLAGGLSDAASEAKVIVARRLVDSKATTVSSQMVEEFEFPISKDLKIDPSGAQFVLKPYDEIYVRRSPGYIEQKTVTINGEVVFGGDYPITERSMRLSQLITKAGGITEYGYIKGASLKRLKTVDELIQEQTLSNVARKKQGRDSLSMDMAMLEQYNNVGIDLQKALENPMGEYDIVLMPGDIINIPQYVNTVKITGAVLYPTTTTYNGSQKLKNYIYQAGGYVQSARKKPFVVYLNGQVAATKGCRRYPQIEPGCIVVVPLKNINPNRLSIAEILGLTNSALSTAAIATSLAK